MVNTVVDNYPNLMCFGRDVSNCRHEGICPDFNACQEAYDQSWLSLFKTKENVGGTSHDH